MTVIESIVRDLNGLPMRKLVEVACYVHRLSETAERERVEVPCRCVHSVLVGNQMIELVRHLRLFFP